MGKDKRRRENDEGSEQSSVRTVRFPTNGMRRIYSNMYGSDVKRESLGMLKKDWEVWVFASLTGSMWFCINVKTADTRSFDNEGALKKWLALEK